MCEGRSRPLPNGGQPDLSTARVICGAGLLKWTCHLGQLNCSANRGRGTKLLLSANANIVQISDLRTHANGRFFRGGPYAYGHCPGGTRIQAPEGAPAVPR